MRFDLPFPPSELSGHNNGRWFNKSRIVATYRAEAFHLARKAKLASGYRAPPEGDISILFLFFPPNALGDRVNFPNRLKPQIDGIAEALGVNDKRFLPSYGFGEIKKPGRVEVTISTGWGENGDKFFSQESGDSAIKKNDPSGALTPSGRDPIASQELTE